MLQRILLCGAFLVIAAGVSASPLTVSSYSYGPGSGPSGSYPDDTGTQLTDGQYNAIIPSANLGTPNAYNWVGWDGYRSPTITFDFGQTVTVTQVDLSTVRWQPAGVYLTPQVTINATPFSVPVNTYTDMDKAVLSFSGSWVGSSLSLTISSGGYWTFADEVTFSGQVGAPQPQPTHSVPDAGSTALLMGLAVTGMALVAPRRHRLLRARRG